jgi:hypothetical protein
MRLRILLPLANVALGALLFHLGDIQVRRITSVSVLAEPLQDGAATARYLDYALNAPVWALLGDTRDKLWSPSTYWRGYDLRYFLAVIAMWFSIGLALDRRFSGSDVRPGKTKAWWNWILAWISLLYGLFVCHSVLPPRPDLMPFGNYLVWLASAVSSGGYGWWWYPLGLAWGMGLIANGLYSLFRLKERATVQPDGPPLRSL